MSVELVQHDNDSLCFHSYMRIHFTLNICWRLNPNRGNMAAPQVHLLRPSEYRGEPMGCGDSE
jgi:hypothetical protein